MKKLPVCILLLIVCGCKLHNVDCKKTFREQYFYTALANFSSSPNYLIAKVKDANSGVVKEICTDSQSLGGAIISEYRTGFLDSLLAKKPCNPVLVFKHNDNLESIGFFNYNPTILDSLRKEIPKSVFDSISILPRFESFKKIWSFSKELESSYFEHLMIENEIGCKRDDETGVTIPVITNK